jgi:hypothetical protein
MLLLPTIAIEFNLTGKIARLEPGDSFGNDKNQPEILRKDIDQIVPQVYQDLRQL